MKRKENCLMRTNLAPLSLNNKPKVKDIVNNSISQEKL